MGCRIDRRNLWTMRIRWEMQRFQAKGFRSSFATLTYDENHYKGGVCKGDIKLFIKRLREHLSRNNDLRNCRQFKYFICSELGENTQRGHYHCIFLGLESSFLTTYIRKTWRKGFCDVSALTPQRISYTLKYMDKQQFGSDTRKYEDDEIVRFPFQLCSKGIGAEYLKQLAKESIETGVIWSNGHFVKFPVYYAKKFGVDTALLNKKMEQNLKRQAKFNKMSVRDYQIKRALSNEEACLSRARLDGHCVTEDSLRVCKSLIKQYSNVGESIASEVLNENE